MDKEQEQKILQKYQKKIDDILNNYIKDLSDSIKNSDKNFSISVLEKKLKDTCNKTNDVLNGLKSEIINSMHNEKLISKENKTDCKK